MCKQPAILVPFNGCSSLYFNLVAIKPGISCSANSISLLPKAARLMSATLNFCAGSPILLVVFWDNDVCLMVNFGSKSERIQAS